MVSAVWCSMLTGGWSWLKYFRLRPAQDRLLRVRGELGAGQAGPAPPPAFSHLTSGLPPGQLLPLPSPISHLPSHLSPPTSLRSGDWVTPPGGGLTPSGPIRLGGW